MPAHGTTKQQVGGYRFIVRRMEHALVRRDARMLDEPMRTQSRSMLVGAVIAALALAGCAVAAWISPAPDTDGARVLLAQDSGALYVRVEAGSGGGSVLHPALNLASARLVVDSDVEPQRVPDSALPTTRRGAVVGIPGAPQRLPGRDSQVAGPWTVCDRLERGAVARTDVLVGEPEFAGEPAASGGSRGRRVGHEDAVLVAGPQGPDGPDGAVREYLLYDGVRSPVDPSDPGVSRALGLDGVEPVRVSAALLGALPEGPRLAAPRVDATGDVPAYPIDGARVGDVLRVARGGGPGRVDHYLVLADGLQAVPPVVADLETYSGAEAARSRTVPPESIAGIPAAANPLDLDGFPAGPVRVDAAGEAVCASFRADRGRRPGGVRDERETRGARGAASTRWSVLTGPEVSVAGAAAPVSLVGADGAGPSVDGFFLRPGAAAQVRAARPGGGRGAGAARGPRFLVSDTGVRYGIPDAHTSTVLGLGAAADAAPWPVLRLLPQGPALTRTDALVVHDSLGADPAPGPLSGG